LGLPEALQRGIPPKTLVFYNGKAEATGGQLIPEGILENILGGYNKYLRYIKDPQNCHEIETVLSEANYSKEMRIVIADYKNL